MRVLLLEEDAAAARSIERVLIVEGYSCDRSALDEGGRPIEQFRKYDLIVLGLSLAERDGHRLIRLLRATAGRAPILILADRDEPVRLMAALDLGADDYLTRPFDQAALIARVQAVVRRGAHFTGSVIRTGNIALNLDARAVFVNDVPVRLTGREFGVLELLSMNKGKTVTKDTILSHLYAGMVEPDQKIIDVFVCTLRRKLAEAGAGDDRIETVWGRGYVMHDPLESSGRDVRKAMAPAAL